MIELPTELMLHSTQGYDLSSPLLCKVIYTSVTCDSCYYSVIIILRQASCDGGASGCPLIGPFSSHPGGSLPI